MLLLHRTPAGCRRGGRGGGWGRVQDQGLPHLLAGAERGQAGPDALALPLHPAGDLAVVTGPLVDIACCAVLIMSSCV